MSTEINLRFVETLTRIECIAKHIIALYRIPCFIIVSMTIVLKVSSNSL